MWNFIWSVFGFISPDCNPNPAEFLKWNSPSWILGTDHYQIKGHQDENLKVGQPAVKSLVRLHRCACWPGSILMAKANHLWLRKIFISTTTKVSISIIWGLWTSFCQQEAQRYLRDCLELWLEVCSSCTE